MKLSSFQRISGLFGRGVGLNDGEFIWEWNAVLTIPHIGHPGFGAKDMKAQRKGVEQPGRGPVIGQFDLSSLVSLIIPIITPHRSARP